MKFRACVEPAERMKGLEVPPQVVEALGGGKRPPSTARITCTPSGADLPLPAGSLSPWPSGPGITHRAALLSVLWPPAAQA